MTPADLQRIEFVTRRFGDLQGLSTVSHGAMLLAMLIEGLPDRRLESHARQPFSDDRHAHTI